MFHAGFYYGGTPHGTLCELCLTALRGRVLTYLFEREGVTELTQDTRGYDPTRPDVPPEKRKSCWLRTRRSRPDSPICC